jgi:hypothetical protein
VRASNDRLSHSWREDALGVLARRRTEQCSFNLLSCTASPRPSGRCDPARSAHQGRGRVRSSVYECASGSELVPAEGAVLVFPGRNDVTKSAVGELAASSVGEPSGDVVLGSVCSLAVTTYRRPVLTSNDETLAGTSMPKRGARFPKSRWSTTRRAVDLLVIGGGVGLRPDVDVRRSMPRPLRSDFEGMSDSWGLQWPLTACQRDRGLWSRAAAGDRQVMRACNNRLSHSWRGDAWGVLTRRGTKDVHSIC